MTDDIVQPLKTAKISLSSRAEHYLRELIANATYQPGEQLPSEKDLAAQLGISRPTLREALRDLEQDGIVVRKHGVGTFVAPGYEQRLDSGLERLESVLQLAADQGTELKCRDLEIREMVADQKLAEKLQAPRKTSLTRIQRVIVADKRPVAYMVDIVPATILAAAEVDGSFNGSVLDLLRSKPDLDLAQAIAEIAAVNADETLAGYLDTQPGRAILLLEELLFDQQGKAVDYSRNYFCPEFFRFHVVRS